MPSPPPTLQNPRNLTSLPQILSSLSAHQSEEVELSNSLSKLLSAQEPIAQSLDRLQTLLPHLDLLSGDAAALSTKVSSTAQTAERVSGRVQSLDEEMRRIREATDRVGQVIDLKSSLADLKVSMESQDWESATRHCARAMSIPTYIVSGRFAEIAVPTSDSHLPPSQTLQTAREELLRIFLRNFEQASQAKDAAATSRFFKLFPAIGWEKEGLEAYASFVVDLVRVRAPVSAKTSSPLYFITTLTALFESVAMIVDQHQPVVEKYYGTGKMKQVVERLLQECDRVVKGAIERWEEERSMARKLLDVQTASQSRRQNPNLLPDEDLMDPREVDKLLIEMSGMVGRWSLFKRFLLDSQDTTVQGGVEDEVAPAVVELALLESTASEKALEDILSKYHTPMELWYIRTIIDKAHRLSTPDMTQTAITTTIPDDVFYVLKVVLTRLYSTGSLAAVQRMMEQLRNVLEEDYIDILKKKLQDVYRNAPPGQSRNEKIDRDNRNAYITILNDLDVSSSHLERLTRDLSSNGPINQFFMVTQQDAAKGQLASLSGLTTKFKSTVRVGVEQLFNQLVRPKLKTFISEVYKDVSYVLDDDAYSNAEYHDLVRKRFIKKWEQLTNGYKDTLSDTNYRVFFGLVLDTLLRPWEKFMLGFKFTELGAIRFDRDLRSIITYLSPHNVFGDAREKFVRLQQMSTLLNLDSEEDVDEFYNGSGISWKLTSQEARTIVTLKV
ncbi:intra-golgi transport-related protein [Moniliophthora roreri MCA 2997]|uniref:Conserved oligomeric Golgi complex subunit 4 n=2 Tax=Moniliophthora roreri TaxID=221103 RepID=V2X3Q2_MONRO|nr:intra-golgi transport-related protein [Moniliophthora roreri MCA 2997]